MANYGAADEEEDCESDGLEEASLIGPASVVPSDGSLNAPKQGARDSATRAGGVAAAGKREGEGEGEGECEGEGEDEDEGEGEGEGEDDENSVIGTLLQLVPTLIISLAGLLFAGYLLDATQSWLVFKTVHELFVLVPVLLGLKGNLDMTLASRLSTAAHAGELGNTLADAWPMLRASMALVQVQAILVSLLSSVIACAMRRATMDLERATLIVVSSVVTMSLSAFALGMFTCALVVVSHWNDFDPDNIATPVVSSLGDLFTLLMLAGVSTLLHSAVRQGAFFVLPMCFAVLLCVLLPWATLETQKHAGCRSVLVLGWPPIIVAMAISLVAGSFLDDGMARYAGLAALVPVLNGSGGNLGCVYAARLCTSVNTREGRVDGMSWVMRLLMALVVPLSLLFMIIVRLVDLGHINVNAPLVLAYTGAGLVQTPQRSLGPPT